MPLAYPRPGFAHQPVPQPQYHYDQNPNQYFTGASEYEEPAAKRPRISTPLTGPEHLGQGSNYPHRLNTDIQPYPQYPPAYNTTSNQAFRHPGDRYSTPSTMSDYHQFGHQPTDSSNASSPHTSPYTDHPYSSVSSNQFPPQHSRDSSFYQPHHSDIHQPKQAPQLGYPTPPRQHDLPPRREITASASHSAAEVLAGMSHAVSDYSATRQPENRIPTENIASSPASTRGRPILPPLTSLAAATGPGSAPQLQNNSVLPPINSDMGRGIDRRSDTQPYQDRQILS